MPASRGEGFPHMSNPTASRRLHVGWKKSSISSPSTPRADLVRELYWAENAGKAQPPGSQDMIGLLYPGVSRLDYDAGLEGGRFPAHVESNCEPEIAVGFDM